MVVSITDPDAPPARLDVGFREVLAVAFHDVIEPVRWGETELAPITPAQAHAVVAFLERWHADADALALLVHCEAGISRSAAVARFAAERYAIPVRSRWPDCPAANITVLQRLREAAERGPG